MSSEINKEAPQVARFTLNDDEYTRMADGWDSYVENGTDSPEAWHSLLQQELGGRATELTVMNPNDPIFVLHVRSEPSDKGEAARYVRLDRDDLGTAVRGESAQIEHGLQNPAWQLYTMEEAEATSSMPSESEPEQLKGGNVDRSIAELDRVSAGRLAVELRGLPDAEARRSALDPNTGDQELRARVASLLRQTIDELGGAQKLPERVQRNDLGNLKSVPSERFGNVREKFNSRDYATKLALAMLDGSFDGDPRKKDYADLPENDPRNGQHRQAARMALDVFADLKRQQDEALAREES